jgi:hypothetical protein
LPIGGFLWVFFLSCSQVFFILWNTENNWIKFESSKPAVQLAQFKFLFFLRVVFTSTILFLWYAFDFVFVVCIGIPIISLLLLWPVDIYFILLALGIAGNYNSLFNIYFD